MINDSPRRYLYVLGLAVFILVPSFDTIAKYFGPAGIPVYFGLGLIAVSAGFFILYPRFRRLISERTAGILAVATFIGLVGFVSVGYPIANSGRFGPGTDVDDAMITAAGELLQGHYPYYLKTYLGLPISPMPGAIFLAIPWVVAGALQYQNVFWLGVFFLLLRHLLNSSVSALGLLWAILALSPTVHQNLLTGSDYVSNTIYVMATAWLTLRYGADRDASLLKKLGSAMFLGVCLSSRSNFSLVLPMVFILLGRAAGWKEAIRASAVAGFVCFAVTFPFWMYDPAGFTPITAQAWKVKTLEQALPFAGVVIPGTALVLALLLSMKSPRTDVAAFFRDNGVVQLYLLLFTSVVFAVQMNQLNLYMATSGYGLFALFFGAAGCWLILNEARSPLTGGRLGSSADHQLD